MRFRPCKLHCPAFHITVKSENGSKKSSKSLQKVLGRGNVLRNQLKRYLRSDSRGALWSACYSRCLHDPLEGLR
eukprot:g80484.t1